MGRWSGLRARVAANLAAAVSLSFGFLAFMSMAIVQGAVRDAERAGVTVAANVFAAEGRACPDEACLQRVIDRARQAGLTVEVREGANATITGHRHSHLWVERGIGARVYEIGAEAAPMVARSQSALTAMIVCLLINGVALVVIGTVLFERGVVSRLGRVDEDMARIERFELDSPLLASEGGDEIGRMAGTLRRISDRLREDKQRTSEYIERLERSNRELREAHEELARSERLATVGRLAAGVAHEIGNPIAAIVGYLEILRRGRAPDMGEYLERIDREARRIDRIVRDLLDFARPQPLSIAPVRLEEVVSAATRLVQPQPRWRSMRLAVDVDAALPSILANEHYAVQVLLNLLINAADACGGKGAVTVRAHAAGTEVVLDVIDDGPGIPERDRARIFDPFFTTKAPGEGAGLGLAISHRIMESFGGRIHAGAADPHGAVFTLTFRAAASGA